jgi:hypothetical protein
VITENPTNNYLTIGTCEKNGSNVKKEFELSRDWNWEIDVKING